MTLREVMESEDRLERAKHKLPGELAAELVLQVMRLCGWAFGLVSMFWATRDVEPTVVHIALGAFALACFAALFPKNRDDL